MLKRIGFFAVFLVLVSVDIFCGEPKVFEHAVSKKNETAFNAVMQGLQARKIITSDFEQTKKMAVLQRPLVSSGRFIFAEKKGICWQTIKPFKMTFVITDKKMIQMEEGKVTMNVSMEKQPLIHGMTSIFKSMFNGNTKELKKYFSLSFIKENDSWVIGLKPKKRKMKKFFQYIVLKGNTYITQVHIFEKNKDATTIDFSGHASPKELSVLDESPFGQ